MSGATQICCGGLTLKSKRLVSSATPLNAIKTHGSCFSLSSSPPPPPKAVTGAPLASISITRDQTMPNSGDAAAKGNSVSGTNPVSPQTGDDHHDRPPRRSHNGGLESNGNLAIPEGSGQSRAGGNGFSIMQQHPTRSDSKTRDCLFFIHTGSCSFGENCRYNHPSPTKSQVGQQGKRTVRFPCKFYLAGFCKNGSYCRFSHSIQEIPPEPDGYNVVGYPLRENQIICSFYMRTGLCCFGKICKFDHPNRYLNNRRRYFVNANGEAFEFHYESSEVTDGGQAKQFSESAQPYYPLASLNYDCYGYQVPNNCTMEMEFPSGSQAETITKADNLQEDLPPQEEKVTENTQEMTSFSIPNVDLKEPLVLNEAGLPLRPGKTSCWFYENLGFCKYGISCAYDHPPKNSSNVQEGSSSNSAPSGESPKTKE